MPLRDALHLARTGQMPEGQSALSLLLCEPLLRERGYLDAREAARLPFRARAPSGQHGQEGEGVGG
jgi:hypothetical protein